MQTKNWVDFKEIKQVVTMQMVLERYGIELKKKGQNYVGCCPIHKGSNSRQFSVHFEKNIWHCFGDCKAGGNVLDFTAMMEAGDKDAASIRKAALTLKEWFMTDTCSMQEDGGQDKEEPPDECEVIEKEVENVEAEGNKPLSFELKHLDQGHPWFASREILSDTVAYFGLGLQKKGKFIANRIAIPIHDHLGNLVAYCGRAINNDQIKKEGKYKLPPKFIKSDVVYNLHRQTEETDTLILVESYISVWKLHQLGAANSVALMGSQLSEAQEKLITQFLGPHKRIICLFDGDESGNTCMLDCMKRLSSSVFVKAVDIAPYAQKPHLLTSEQLHACLFIPN